MRIVVFMIEEEKTTIYKNKTINKGKNIRVSLISPNMSMDETMTKYINRIRTNIEKSVLARATSQTMKMIDPIIQIEFAAVIVPFRLPEKFVNSSDFKVAPTWKWIPARDV